ncbi:MAG: SRPBCC domain-containing protein, partial [Rhodococcus sp. (in: high G+C Gram-positive bacteria)]
MSTSQSPTTATLSTPTDREIHVERIFDASRSRVWAAFTKPELLAQWWGRGNSLDVERWEFERGGHWRVVEHADGDSYGFEGRFREITPEERLVYTFEWDGMPGHVIIENNTYTDLGDGRTQLSVVSQFHTPE